MKEQSHLVLVKPMVEQSNPLQPTLEKNFLLHQAQNGEEALRQIAEIKPSLVLSPLVLADMTGYALCRRLRDKPDFSRLPFLLVTHATETCDVCEALSSGVDAVLRAETSPKWAVMQIDSVRQQIEQGDQEHLQELDLLLHGQSLHLRTEWRRIASLLASLSESQSGLTRRHAETTLQTSSTASSANTMAALSHELRDQISCLLALAESVHARAHHPWERELAQLIKPIANSLLNLADPLFEVQRRLGSARPDVHDIHLDQPKGALRILLAEDNPVNQAFVIHLLSGTGDKVTAVPNGYFALDALARNTYDLVLMDIQMPELDGVETTRAIRSGAADRPDLSNRDIPIIALTAHAMPGDRDRFLSAGMDDYLPKPVTSEQLIESITTVMRRAQSHKAGPAHPGPAIPTTVDDKDKGAVQAGVLNTKQTLRRLRGDREFMLVLYNTFLQDFDNRLAKLRAAYSAADFKALKMQAHALKGAALTIDAAQTSQAALALEMACRDNDPNLISSALDTVQQELTTLQAALQNACKSAD